MWKTDEERRKYHREWRRNNSRKKNQKKELSENVFQCHICNAVVGIKGITKHLLVHDIKKEEYIKKYLDEFERFGWTLCPICGKLTKGTTCSRKCGAKLKSKLMKGNIPWNVGLTKETSEIVAEIGRKVSESNTGNPLIMGDNNPATRLEVRKKISESMKGKLVGKKNGMYGKTHTKESLRKIFNKRSMTKPEKIAQRCLNESGFDVTPQWFLTEDGITYSYDFFLNGPYPDDKDHEDTKILVEVDGDYWHGGPGCEKPWYGVEETKKKDKIKNLVARRLGFFLIRIWESELKDDPAVLINRINEVIEQNN